MKIWRFMTKRKMLGSLFLLLSIMGFVEEIAGPTKQRPRKAVPLGQRNRQLQPQTVGHVDRTAEMAAMQATGESEDFWRRYFTGEEEKGRHGLVQAYLSYFPVEKLIDTKRDPQDKQKREGARNNFRNVLKTAENNRLRQQYVSAIQKDLEDLSQRLGELYYIYYYDESKLRDISALQNQALSLSLDMTEFQMHTPEGMTLDIAKKTSSRIIKMRTKVEHLEMERRREALAAERRASIPLPPES